MIDIAEFEVAAGRGGNGAVSFRREKFVPRGGPDGGDGGRGGTVIVVADARLSTLQAYRDGRRRAAADGKAGGSKRMTGASARDLVLTVPAGSVLSDAESGETIADLGVDGATVVICRGGRGGRGNKRFATSVRQTPHFAQRGAAGERRRLRIELKLLADVGLVGLPNTGKSTLLRAWSAAHPKVAAYPFTTLEPELGVVPVAGESFVAADMPGLIAGASEGVGLGHEFLRHIERTRVLVHLLDLTRDDPLADRALIDRELAAFGHGLAEKPQLLALNKIDHPDGRAHFELLRETGQLPRGALAISGLSGEGVTALALRALALLREQQAAEQRAPLVPVLRPEPRRARIAVQRAADGVAVVEGGAAEYWAATLDLDDLEARYELWQRLKRMGVARALARAGVQPGERVRIGEQELRWES